MRLIGLDYGTKTMGVAISDELKILASPVETVRYDSFDELFSKLDLYFNKYKFEAIVLGNPKNLDGSLSDRSVASLDMKKMLEERYNIPVHMEDERFTSVIANNMLISNGERRKDRKSIFESLYRKSISKRKKTIYFFKIIKSYL